ncbi:MAG TPA: hypothetical protein VF828_01205 [Patescibacteria group bacterium]
MDIPNLSSPNPNETPVVPAAASKNNIPVFVIVGTIAIVVGFFLSRFFPSSASSLISSGNSANSSTPATIDIQDGDKPVVGKVYGNTSRDFKDMATGTIEKGSINGEGTHILNREGGVTQRAALTSAAVDLDLFVGKKVEVKGETQSSTKVGWLLDVGTIKILE